MKSPETTRGMTLKYIIEQYSPYIVPVLRENIMIKPEVQKLGGVIKIPNTYEYDDGET